MPENDTQLRGKMPFPSSPTDIAARVAKRSATATVTANSPDYKARVERDKYLEETEFLEMAREAGFRLPKYGQKVTTGKMTAWIRKVGSTVPKYLAWSGEKSLTVFAKANPDWPFRSFAVLVLEAHVGGKL